MSRNMAAPARMLIANGLSYYETKPVLRSTGMARPFGTPAQGSDRSDPRLKWER